MKQLSFKGNNNTEWRECKNYYHEIFFEELNKKALRDAKAMIQSQIDEEFDMQIGAAKYERREERQDKRNGYRIRSYEVLGGYIDNLKIPRARKLDIRFSVFNMWERVQVKVLNAMVKAYIFGKSSRSAQDIIEAFGQSRFSRSYLQKLVRKFEQGVKNWHRRRINKVWPYVFIDGMAVKVRDVYLKEQIVIFAIGMDEKHNTELLGWVIVDNEDEMAVRSLLIDLKNRGLEYPELFITDGSKGIRAAIKLEYSHSGWQLCSFHKIKNIQDHLVNIKKHRKCILRQAGDIYQEATNKKEAVERFNKFKKDWQRKEPEAVRLFAEGFEDTLRYFEYPKDMWKSIRTSNQIEQFIGKLRAWLSKFKYFQGKANLELAMFTYLCYRTNELVLPLEFEPNLQKDTLLVA